MAPNIILVVAGILRENDRVLLVQQQGVEDPYPTWAFPGGVVEAGETLPEALQREIQEETGLLVVQIGGLAYLVQIDNEIENSQSFAFVFEVPAWSGNVHSADPDDLILKAEFVPVPESVRRLSGLPWRAMREPAVACLAEEASPGALWYYRLCGDGLEYRIKPS